jgi:hypothetical protein
MSIKFDKILGAVRENDIGGPLESTYIELEQITTPSNPAAGKDRLYFKANEKLYKLTSAGVESEIGAGSGGGFAYFPSGW